MLSDTKIKSIKAKEKLFRITDAKGLVLEITTNGSTQVN
jgi:hypothetical protein